MPQRALEAFFLFFVVVVFVVVVVVVFAFLNFFLPLADLGA